MSEDLPLPKLIDTGDSRKEAILAQYYRTDTSNTGITLTLDSSTYSFLPTNSYNKTHSVLGTADFPLNSSVTLNKTGAYMHNIYVYGHSTVPDTGIVGIDLVDAGGVQYGTNVFATKNWNNSSTDNIILSTVIESNGGSNFRLRFGGGVAGTGAPYTIQVLAVMWTISQK
jgi:hypothetical protein